MKNDEDLCPQKNHTLPLPTKTPQLFADERRWPMFSLLITLLLIYYSIPIIYVIYNRNQAAIRTRSPIMIVIVCFCLMCDSMLNATLFTLDSTDHTKLICSMGIFTTVVPFIGAMVFYLMRMWRMLKFFQLYKQCLYI